MGTRNTFIFFEIILRQMRGIPRISDKRKGCFRLSAQAAVLPARTARRNSLQIELFAEQPAGAKEAGDGVNKLCDDGKDDYGVKIL